MAHLIKAVNELKGSVNKGKLGSVGYDNPRENIDKRITTQSVITKEVFANSVRVTTTDAGTNTVVAPLTIQHDSRGTVSNDFGVGVGFRLEDSGGGIGESAKFTVRWTDIANARNAFLFSTNNAANIVTIREQATNDARFGVRTIAPSSTLDVSGSVRFGSTATTGTYRLLNDANCFVPCDTNSNAITIGLPTASGITGRIYVVSRISGGNNVVISGTNLETIAGQVTSTLSTAYQTTTVISDGTNWQTI